MNLDAPSSPPRQSRLSALCKGLAIALLIIAVLWALAALYFSSLPEVWRWLSCSAFAIVVALVFLLSRSWPATAAAAAVLVVLVLAWWLTLTPRNDLPWQADVKMLPVVEFDGDTVHVKHIRDFIYVSEFDFRPRYADEKFALDQLQTVDLFLIYWGSPAIAHTIVSFGLDDGRQLAVSIETRKQIGQKYSAVRGFFRQFTLIYVMATERDVIRLRTNLRKEDVYLYRLRATPQMARAMFLQYAAHINRLAQRAEWYNAVADNCTTSIRKDIYAYMPNKQFDWRLLANGYIDEMLYERGTLDTRLPFDELKRRSYINPRAQALPESAAFSREIRQGLPGFDASASMAGRQE